MGPWALSIESDGFEKFHTNCRLFSVGFPAVRPSSVKVSKTPKILEARENCGGVLLPQQVSYEFGLISVGFLAARASSVRVSKTRKILEVWSNCVGVLESVMEVQSVSLLMNTLTSKPKQV